MRLPKEFRFDTEVVSIERDGDGVVLRRVETPRDKKGWPLAFWQIAGADPDFDVGAREVPHERRDPLVRPR